MRLTRTIISCLASVGVVRAAAGIVCEDVNFSKCRDIQFPGNFQCVSPLGSIVDKISSFSVAPGFACRFYDNLSCSDTQGILDNQRGAVADLRTIGWNDRIASYLCTIV